MLRLIPIIFIICSLSLSQAKAQQRAGTEQHRPQFHHAPTKDWMNDPNGMVFFEGEYHLFFQHDKYEKVFGNMSWGHAISADLVHWTEYPDPIVPDGDSLGLIFSGSTVIDKNNTAGFGINAFVAVYTSTKPNQQQSLAYSTDKGRTWTKYNQNPVIKNEKGDDIPDDFRDPKVHWNKTAGRWIMSLAAQDHIEFWSSKNLKDWKKESEFGKDFGAHGGVWECPDLFELPVDGDPNNKRWVLLVSINPGGPNGGSATQYFIGDYDGKKFILDKQFQRYLETKSAIQPTANKVEGRWVDYGTDNYAGVTWSNLENRAIVMGWMSNWQYAGLVPTKPWRGANTFPRELGLKSIGNDIYLTSAPVKELEKIIVKTTTDQNLKIKGILDLSNKISDFNGQYQLKFNSKQLEDYSVTLSNDLGEQLIIGYEKATNRYYIDRSKSGKINFEKDFGVKHFSPRIASGTGTDVILLIDAASVEFFADNGLNVMTEIFFSNRPLNKLSVSSAKGITMKEISYAKIDGIWK